MIDAPKSVLDYLLAVGALTALTGARIYAERSAPPPGYTPADGGCICFKRRGGTHDHEAVTLFDSYQFKCYGATEVAANDVYRALFDALTHQADSANNIKWTEAETGGQTLEERETGWVYVLAFFRVMIVN